MLATGNKQLGTYRLSIRTCAGGFSFSVINVFDGKVMRQRKAELSATSDAQTLWQEMLNDNCWKDYDYSSVEMVVAQPATFVPLELFQKEDVTAIYKLNFPSFSPTREIVKYEVIPDVEVVAVYAVDKAAWDAVSSAYPEAELHSQDAQSITWAYTHAGRQKMEGNAFYALVREEGMTLCTFADRKLQFACTYNITSDADRLYHLLSVWKALATPQSGTSDMALHITGASDHLLKTLSQYIRNIRLCE